jgi:predicted DNA-binding antitoxin AbrB/MazE fold protein
MNSIRVKYEDGVFKPLERTEAIKEGSIGEVRVEKRRERPSVKSSEFFGLWKHRRDIADGLSYTRELRSRSRY